MQGPAMHHGPVLGPHYETSVHAVALFSCAKQVAYAMPFDVQ